MHVQFWLYLKSSFLFVPLNELLNYIFPKNLSDHCAACFAWSEATLLQITEIKLLRPMFSENKFKQESKLPFRTFEIWNRTQSRYTIGLRSADRSYVKRSSTCSFILIGCDLCSISICQSPVSHRALYLLELVRFLTLLFDGRLPTKPAWPCQRE